jgi:hypothetical protein
MAGQFNVNEATAQADMGMPDTLLDSPGCYRNDSNIAAYRQGCAVLDKGQNFREIHSYYTGCGLGWSADGAGHTSRLAECTPGHWRP